MERGWFSGYDYSFRTGTPSDIEGTDPRLLQMRIRAIDHDATRALLEAGLADALVAAKVDIIDIDDHAVKSAVWGSVLRASTLRRALDAATSITACIEASSRVTAASWRRKAVSVIEALATNDTEAGGPFRARSPEPRARLAFDGKTAKAHGQMDDVTIEVQAIVHDGRPTTEIVLTLAKPASLSPLLVDFERRAFTSAELPPGPRTIASDNMRFDARWRIKTGGGWGELPPAVKRTLHPWMLETIDGRSPLLVWIRCLPDGMREPDRVSFTVMTETPCMDKGALAREVEAWVELARRFVATSE